MLKLLCGRLQDFWFLRFYSWNTNFTSEVSYMGALRGRRALVVMKRARWLWVCDDSGAVGKKRIPQAEGAGVMKWDRSWPWREAPQRLQMRRVFHRLHVDTIVSSDLRKTFGRCRINFKWKWRRYPYPCYVSARWDVPISIERCRGVLFLDHSPFSEICFFNMNRPFLKLWNSAISRYECR